MDKSFASYVAIIVATATWKNVKEFSLRISTEQQLLKGRR